MNKTILFVLIVFLSIALFASFASANKSKEPKVNPKKELGCKCKSRSVLKCGLGKSDEAAICRKKYIQSCSTRCTLLKKCAAKIAEKCATKKQGSIAYKKCERTTAASYCVSEIDKSLIKDCKCKTFARALCGASHGKDFVRCRDTAEDACRKKCGPKLECTHKKRICISQSNCSCKKISRTKCEKSENFKTCYESELQTCNKRCVATTRCFPLSCKKAGFKRCGKAVEHFCNKYGTGTEEHTQCVTKQTERCQAFEFATCKKARRLFRYRAECSDKAEKVCGKYKGAEKCSCISKERQTCIDEKIVHRKIFIRHQKSCKTRAKLLCDAKKCDDVQKCYEEETRRCHRRCKRRHDIVPPTCVDKVLKLCGNTAGKCYKKHIKRCTSLWLKRYCEHKSFESCDGDFECMKLEISKCKKKLPKCFTDRSLCCDFNKCTTDVCHPKTGCVNVPKDCNDNNLCTVDSCDATKGCVHTEVKCDDGVDCTIDTCNYKNGKCDHVSDHSKCKPTKKCETGVCDNKKGCVFHQQYDETKCGKTCDQICSGKCIASGPCDVVTCSCNENLEAVCTRKQRDCSDGKECTLDYCDISSGKCIHKCIKSAECGECQICEKNQDCSSFAERHKLFENCQVAVCHSKKGVCVPEKNQNQKCCAKSECDVLCKPRNACDVGCTCSKNEKGVCVANHASPLPCDDNNDCTSDSCNEKTGTCEHKVICEDYCQHDLECTAFATKHQLAEKCEEAFCNTSTKKCEKRDLPKKPFCKKKCDLNCSASNKCEEAKCIPVAEGWKCAVAQKSCTDNNPCTIDYCDKATGNCLHKSKVCLPCQESCIPKDKCHDARCVKDEAGNYKCVHDDKPKSCDDHNDCTDDSCDAKLGCVHVYRKDCFNCKEKCQPRNKCEQVSCEANEAGNGYKCVYSTISCEDGDKCTFDHCDIVTGKCVHTAKNKDECKKCEVSCDGCTECVQTDDKKDWACRPSDRKCDDKDECTDDYCDSSKGKCVHKRRKGCTPCIEDADCKHTNFKLKNACTAVAGIGGFAKCKKGYCDYGQKGCCNLKNCFARNKCEDAFCVTDELGRPTCKRVERKCNDGVACTKDYCDTKTGACRHIAFECCNADKDCASQDAAAQKLCKKAVCNSKTRKCDIVEDKSKVCCPVECTSKNQCDSAKCVFDANGKPVCLHTQKSCDDGDVCTVDTCDIQKGCVHTKLEGCCSKSDNECAEWAKKHKLSDCFTARCDIERGRCSKVLIQNPPSTCKPKPCDIDCKTTNPCETAECVPNSENPSTFVCIVKQISCNDFNNCTTDSCDATGKCINTPIDSPECHCNKDSDCPATTSKCKVSLCDSETKVCVVSDTPNAPGCVCDLDCVAPNLCQEAYCDFDENKKPYCKIVNKTTCYDGNDCTLDYCNVQTGDCVHEDVYNLAKCFKCEDKLDCVKWGNDQNLYAKCQTPVCDTERFVCVAQDIADKSRCCPNCQARNPCESAVCTPNAQNQPVCKITSKNCDDGIDCTRDYCDTKTGECKHVNIRKNCCSADKDCAQLNTEVQKSCKKAYCDLKRKTCRVVKDTSKVCKCAVDCVANNKCETAECSLDKDNNSICIRTKKSCDDGDKCTVDSCDSATGACVHTRIASKICCPNTSVCPPPTCDKDAECAQWAINVQLSTTCKGAKCDLEQRQCVTFDLQDQSTCKKCNIPCVSTNPCQTAQCEPDSENPSNFVCITKDVTCNDNNNCTTDSCDSNGKCINTPIYSPGCFCNQDSDCPASTSKCTKSTCDIVTKNCVTTNILNSPDCVCDLDCSTATSNLCQEAYCDFDENKKPYCKVVNKTSSNCYDGDRCTQDYCNALTGDCVFVSLLTPECHACQETKDCAQWGIDQNLLLSCKEAVCVSISNSTKVCESRDKQDKTLCGCPDCVASNCVDTKCVKTGLNSYTCQRTPKNCNDGFDCTTDSCDKDTGLCVHTAVDSKCDDLDNCTIDTCDVNKGCSYTSVKPSAQCISCNATTDCGLFAIQYDLDNKCLEPFCNKHNHCKSRPKLDKSKCPHPCNCPTKNCFVSDCTLDENNKPICTYSAKSCNDNVDCTIDTCDATTGLCVNTPKDNNTKLCSSYLNCISWFQGLTNIENKQCKTSTCTGGCCKVVVDSSKPNCPIQCPPDFKCSPSSVCENATCVLTSKGVQCVSSPLQNACNDGDNCTTDSCDAVKGCVHTFVPGPQCQCQGPQCNCNCKSTSKCATSTLVTFPNGTCKCDVKPIDCNDNINCTYDSCDESTGTCSNVFQTSQICTTPCTSDVQCFLYGHEQGLASKCQAAVCNATLGACQAVDEPECHKCQQKCTSKNCDTAQCVKEGKEYKCVHTPKVCDDQKTCTVDSIDYKTCQCVHTFDTLHCTERCNKTLDCASWAQSKQLYQNCSHAVCDETSGSCHVVPDKDTSRCNPTCTLGNCTTNQCFWNSDCAQDGLGSVCYNGTCVPNTCTTTLDCASKAVNGECCSCVQNTTTFASFCYCNAPNPVTKKCTNCDDKNICTRDVLLPEYSFCEHIPKCDDHNACTKDLCIPSADGKTYTCSHTTISCSSNCTLAKIPADQIPADATELWVGKCDKNLGCLTCCSTGQCDDHNGCTQDSCANQQCQNKLIDNIWCDPKIANQPINFQSIPGLRDKLALAGYDIAKLGE